LLFAKHCATKNAPHSLPTLPILRLLKLILQPNNQEWIVKEVIKYMDEIFLQAGIEKNISLNFL